MGRQYGNAGEREQRWHQKAPGHRETLSLSESCPQPSSISAYSLAAGEPCHERTFDGHATAAGAGLLEHTFGKLRAAPLSREFLRRLGVRSEEHTSELQSLMRHSYAVFCLKKKNNITLTHTSRN